MSLLHRPVLMVEDNRDDAALAFHAIEVSGHRNLVHLVRDGAAAMDYLFGPDAGPRVAALKVVVLDIKLPMVGGIDVLRRMKADEATRTIPTVMFTSSGEGRDRDECFRLGVNSYVVKPVDFASFSDALVRLLRYWLEINEAAPPRGRGEPRVSAADATGV